MVFEIDWAARVPTFRKTPRVGAFAGNGSSIASMSSPGL